MMKIYTTSKTSNSFLENVSYLFTNIAILSMKRGEILGETKEMSVTENFTVNGGRVGLIVDRAKC